MAVGTNSSVDDLDDSEPNSGKSRRLGEEIVSEMMKVTLEEFRLTEIRFETDCRLGRELLYLLANSEWLRRTTETVDISRVVAVDTRIVVDVDPSYIVHEALRIDQGPLWLPLIALPPEQPAIGGEVKPPPPSPGRAWLRRRSTGRATALPDLPVSIQVLDAHGDRLAEMPQAEVRRQLAAALAEALIGRINRRTDNGGPSNAEALSRDHQVLMAATITQILAVVPDLESPRSEGLERPAPELLEPTETPGKTRHGSRNNRLEPVQEDIRATLGREIKLIHAATVSTSDETAPGPSPRIEVPSALMSREAQILQSVRGIMLVVVPVAPHTAATSFTVQMPSRRLAHEAIGWHRFIGWHRSVGKIRIALLVPSAHADRVIEVLVPDGVTTVPDKRGAAQVQAEITLLAPQQFEQLRRLIDWLLNFEQDQPTAAKAHAAAVVRRPWVRKQLAELAVVKLEAVIQSLHHHYALEDDDDGSRTEILLGQLWRLQVALDGEARDEDHEAEIRRLWEDLRPHLAVRASLRRRLERNTASPGSVRFRASAIEEFTLRAEPIQAFVSLTVASEDSPVLGTAGAINGVNIVLLCGLAVGLWLQTTARTEFSESRAQVLSALLTVFPAIQAARVARPDPGRLVGLLQVSHFVIGLATAVPALLLAGALAFAPGGRITIFWAMLAVALQLCVHVAIRRDKDAYLGRLRPGVELYTINAPEHAGQNALRTAWCRSLTGEALLIGRTAFPYLVTEPDNAGGFQDLLRQAQQCPAPDVPGTASPVNLLGVLLGAARGGRITFLVFRDEPPGLSASKGVRWPGQAVTPFRFERGRLVPMEPPTWILDLMIGTDRARASRMALAEHPLLAIARACEQAKFTILNVRMPAPPPLVDPDDREWLRLRVGVPYRHGDSLRALVAFLGEVDGLSSDDIRVYLREVPQMASVDSTQTAPEDSFDQVVMVTDTSQQGRLATAGDVGALIGADQRSWFLMPVFAPIQVGLIARVLSSVGRHQGSLSLASVLSGVINGISVIFIFCRNSQPDGKVRSDLKSLIVKDLERTDRVFIPYAGPVVPDTSAAQSSDQSMAARVLLAGQVRTPDRPGALQQLLAELKIRIAEAVHDRSLEPLDLLYALTPVVDGHALAGRFVVRLPPHPEGDEKAWGDVEWADVARAVARGLANGTGSLNEGRTASYDRTAQLSDDTVVTLEMIRMGISAGGTS